MEITLVFTFNDMLICRKVYVRYMLLSDQGMNDMIVSQLMIPNSVTRLGDLLDFEQLFKAIGTNLFVQISHILRQFL